MNRAFIIIAMELNLYVHGVLIQNNWNILQWTEGFQLAATIILALGSLGLLTIQEKGEKHDH
jgi:hypothetical protein